MSSNLMEIIIKAVDQASDTASKVDDKLKKVGDTAQQANQKAASASKLTQQQMNNLSHEIKEVIASTDQVGAKGESQFNRYDNALQDSIVTFNRLDEETQEMLRYLSQMSDKGRETFLGMSTKAQEAVSKFNQLENETTGWNNVLDITKTKMELVGSSTTSLPGKIQMVGTAITTHLGNKWDSLKTKVSGFGNYIKSTLGSALTHVKGMVNSLGSAFSGLGGMISTAIGGLGMASISQMTVGLAMNRERMTALTSATMGSAEAGKEFVGVMDELTNSSLVSLDDLGQAMSTIKMSTGMTNDQLKDFTTTVNDVGQRAILMGKSGDEAIGLMQAAGRGLNGEFDMLKTNFGITADKLKELGWSGAADDVKGYQDALDKALQEGGEMNGMMDTSVGHLETLKKNFRIAGRHVGEQFTPYIDQAVQYLNNLNDTCPGLFENLVMVAGGISMFATVAPTLAPMLTAMDSLWGGGKKVLTVFRESSVIQGFWTALSSGEGILAAITAGYDAMAISEYIALGPLLAIIAAIIAIGVAVYELGKYFGWWNDVGSMLQAVWAGLQRLWSAFINHPDVQAAISAISNALHILGQWIGYAWKEILKFFGVSTGSNWDAVRAIIDSIGQAWSIITGPIRMVITVLQALYNFAVPIGQGIYEALKPIVCILLGCSPGIVPALQTVYEVFVAVWSAIFTVVQPIISIIVGLMQRLVAIFNAYRDGQISLPTLIIAVLTQLWNAYQSIFSLIIQAVIKFGSQIVSKGISAASRFVSGIVNRISQLPGQVGSKIRAVISTIASAMAAWISTGLTKAAEFVSQIPAKFSEIPGKISSALSGVVDAITKPFRDAYDNLCKTVDDIKRKAEEVTGIAFGGDTAYGGDTAIDTSTGSTFYTSTGAYIGNNEPVEVEETIKLILDFKNVPQGMDLDVLIKYLTDPKVLTALVENPKFQTLDAKVKSKIEAKVRRSKGV